MAGGHHFLRKAVPQPIEDEVPARKTTTDSRPSASQPFPVAERAVEEQHLLIRDRIRCVIGFRLSSHAHVRRRLLHRVDDRRREKPERQQVAEQVLEIAEVHRQRREEQRQADREHQLHQHDDREPEQLERIDRPLVVDQERRQDRQAEEEVHHVRQHGDDRQHFRGEQHLLDQVAAGDQRVGRLESDEENHVHGRMPQNMNSAYGSISGGWMPGSTFVKTNE